MVKEKIMDWFIRHFIIQKAIQYDQPGFVITKFKTSKGEVFQREVFFPESLIISLESRIVAKYGPEGKSALYSIGKTLGFNFAAIFKSPNVTTNKEEEIHQYIEFVVKYNFATWAQDLEIKDFDIKKGLMILEAHEHIVCRKNGLGLLLTEGAEAGFASYILSDESIEVTQEKCQGRGDDKCIIRWGHANDFKNIRYISGEIFYKISEDIRDRRYNDIVRTTFAKESMYSLIKKGVFTFKDGKVSYEGERYFDSGLITYYLLEFGLKKLPNATEILFDIGYEFGNKIAHTKNREQIINYLSALGWGDVMFGIKDQKDFVLIDHFPWSILEKQIEDFSLIRGLTSGILTALKNQEIKFRKVEKITNNYENKFAVRFY